MQRAMPFLILSAIALLLHGVWEHAHVVLYTGYGAMEGALPAWANATIGDLIYTLLIIAVISLAKGNAAWLRSPHASDLCAAAVIGLLLALMVEYKGLYLGRWEYLASMPIIPMLGVGLSPVLQMALLTPLSLFLTRMLVR